jgi:hypothetical protein
MAAIDAKSKRRWDNHPRIVRKKPQPIVLDDEAEARLRMSEAEYRRELFRSFVKWAREHDGVVISQPWHSPALVLVPLGDGETSALEIALERLPKYKVTKLPATATRLSHGIFQTMRQIEVHLWRG